MSQLNSGVNLPDLSKLVNVEVTVEGQELYDFLQRQQEAIKDLTRRVEELESE